MVYLKFKATKFIFAMGVILFSLIGQAGVRQDHARELLGKYFERSPASRALVAPIEKLIAAEFYERLPSKFKSQARALAQLLIEKAREVNLDPLFVLSVIKTESNFNPEALGSVGEMGLMQLRPETARWIATKFKIGWTHKRNLKNPTYNVSVGIAYLSYLKSHFDNAAAKYLPAYNAGPGKVKDLFEKKTPPQRYSLKVMTNYRNFYLKWTSVES